MEYFAYKSKCKKILEIGCGTGKHTIEMTKRNYNVIDFDFSESQLKKPKEKALANNLQI